MSEMVSVMVSDEKIKQFDKEQLELLIKKLKDIDNFSSFRNGSFIYDLGRYEANILNAYIDDLEQKIDKVSKYLCQLLQEAYLEESSNIDIGLIEYAVDLLKGENNE